MNQWRAEEAEQAAYADVSETCPEVDRAMSAATDAIKVQTHALREALIKAHADRLEAEEAAEDLRRRVKELEGEVRDLEREADALRDRVCELEEAR
jgi:predicted  nucleic acid-binding Zn-ribbon protein